MARRVLPGLRRQHPAADGIGQEIDRADQALTEALEVRVEPALLGGILPLFEHENPRAIAEHGSSYFQFPTRESNEGLVGEEVSRALPAGPTRSK